MTEKLLDLASEIEEDNIFDMEKIEKDFGYYPFYDKLIQYCKAKGVAENYGVTHFSWYADITKEEAVEFLKNKFKEYLR